MTDDTASTPEGASDIEARLRHALSHRAGGEPSTPADWGDFAGRLASVTRRRQRVLVGAAALALCIGAAGGYFGEAAVSPVPVAAHAPGAGGTPSTTVVPGRAGSAAQPEVMCPDISGGSTANGSGDNGSGDIGSATQEFIRTTTDGVTIRVYQDAPSTSVCNGLPTPVAGSGPNSASGSSGSSGSSAPPSTTVPPSTPLEPLAPIGNDVSIELSDADAVGQGAMSSPQCVASPDGGTTGGSGTGSAGQAGSSPASPPPGTIAPSNTPDTATPVTTIPSTIPMPRIPVTTTTTTAAAPGQPQELASGAFGVVEGDPVWWVAVQVGANVTSVQMTFPDGSTDQMAPVDGIAVLAHRVAAAVATADTGPYVVRGSLELQGSAGSVIGTVTLPQTATTPGPVPSPLPAPVPLNQGTATVSPGVIMVCPPSSTITPQAQSSATEKR
jgi:hypothetical protein